MRSAPPSPGLMPGTPAADVSGLSLSWFAVGLPCLPALAVWLLARPSLLGADHSATPTVAWVHLLVLGLLGSCTFGAAYQLMPVAMGGKLPFARLPWWHLLLHGLGFLGLVLGLAHGSYRVAAVAGTLLVVGFGLFAANSLVLFSRTGRKDPVACAFLAATLWLLLTGLAGVLVALNRSQGFLPQPTLSWLRLHAHFGLVGFFVTLIQGAAFRLLPMFTLGDVRDWGRAAFSLGLTQAGLFGLSFAWVEGLEAGARVFAVLLFVGVALAVRELSWIVSTRRKRALDWGLQAFVCGGVLLLLAGLGGLCLLFVEEAPGAFEGRAPALYGLLLLGGGLLPMVCGMLLKIVPFLVWMRAYAPRLGKGPVPLAAQLSTPWLEQCWLEAHLLSVVLLALGLVRDERLWLPAGALVLLLSCAAFVLCVGRSAWHLRKAAASPS